MASLVSTGSPRMGRRATPRLLAETSSSISVSHGLAMSAATNSTTSLSSQATKAVSGSGSSAETHASKSHTIESTDSMNNILAHLRVNDMRQSGTLDNTHTRLTSNEDLDHIISKLDVQHKVLKKQEAELRESSGHESSVSSDLSSGSDVYVRSEGDHLRRLDSSEHNSAALAEHAELARIKSELEAAKSIINRQEMELNESRNLKHTMEQAIGPSSEADFPMHTDVLTNPNHIQSTFNATARPFTSFGETPWPTGDALRSEFNYRLASQGTKVNQMTSRGPVQAVANESLGMGLPEIAYQPGRDLRGSTIGYTGISHVGIPAADGLLAGNRAFVAKSNYPVGLNDRSNRGPNINSQFPVLSRMDGLPRTGSTFSDPLSPILHTNFNLAPFTGNGHYGFRDRQTGGPISPVSPEFPPINSQSLLPAPSVNSQTYITPLEPMNYRRLLDKSVSCDWKYIVDKIVCNNDQQASIFLQQKLKVGTAEQKYEIVESIVNQAYPLMINRFGNFLVQRCFEHGTPEQVISIANAIHGNVISLSMDPFGCHVIQKAFDSVPEDHKADMVRELLRRIPDTVIHRYACHVWQKLFELRWSGEPPQIMLKVNEALRGMWHEVALGETGSLVVQNIFENCVEEEKRPAIEEVIGQIDLIAHGQFGNWCIQHLCEHGSPPDKRRVIDHILTNAYSYSIDQFASKVVEKCLKIGGPEFLDKYLAAITTARPDRPRIPLIDIAGDQYGNYLIQWILSNTPQHQQEQVAIHIRKHMVSLRGSKFGSRVAMLCSHPAATTRPGPTTTLISPYHAPSQAQRSTVWPRYR